MKSFSCAIIILVTLAYGRPFHAQDVDPQQPTDLGQVEDTDNAATGAAPATQPDPNAQSAPFLRMDFAETEAIPGQFLTLRLTILVPTFMPDPPVWPSFEAPNLLVRVPERATSPISERIDGETWSGVSRRYRIAPMVPGDFALPPQDIVVTWRDPATNAQERVSLTTETLRFSGLLPEGAENLDPFIAAEDLTLTQQIEGDPGKMAPGDSVRRTVTAEVAGVSPMFLPPLLQPAAVDGIAAYPDEPRLTETDNRGVFGGKRIETATYVAESGGAGTLPEIALDWYNLGTGAVETARAEAVEIAVDGPSATFSDPGGPQRVVGIMAGGIVCAVLLALLLRSAIPRLRGALAAHRVAYLASEDHAWRALSQAVSSKDLAGVYSALDRWASRVNGADPRRDPGVQSALVALGGLRFDGLHTNADPRDAWRKLDAALRKARNPAKVPVNDLELPPLNPGAST